jgi:hypothetical protein
MNREFAHIAKEEILRNVIKTHTIVLLLGWNGVGKTVSALRAVKGRWKTYYFNASGETPSMEMLQHNSDAIILVRLVELPTGPPADGALIIDDFDGATEEIVSTVKTIISERVFPGKIIIIAAAQPKLEELGLAVDAVIRMKEDTAQVLYTRLRDISR